MVKPNPESAKYSIRLKYDNKGDVFGISLHSKRRNTTVKDVLVFDTALLYQYDITYPQMLYLDKIQKLWEQKHKVTTSDINKSKMPKGCDTV